MTRDNIKTVFLAN